MYPASRIKKVDFSCIARHVHEKASLTQPITVARDCKLEPWIRIPIDLKSWIGIRIEANADPQHWLKVSIILVLGFHLNRAGNCTSGIENGGGNGQLGLEVRVFVLQRLEKLSNFVNFVLWRADTDSTLGLKLNINLLLIEKQRIKITKQKRFILYSFRSDPDSKTNLNSAASVMYLRLQKVLMFPNCYF